MGTVWEEWIVQSRARWMMQCRTDGAVQDGWHGAGSVVQCQVLHGLGRASVMWFPAPGIDRAGCGLPRMVTLLDIGLVCIIYIPPSGNILPANANDSMKIRNSMSLEGKGVPMFLSKKW